VVQRDCGLDNTLAGFILALSATVEYVLSGDFRDLQWDLIIDKSPVGVYCPDQYTAVSREYAMETS
jgi:hypothetical protein